MTNQMIYVYAALITAGSTLTAGAMGAGIAAYFQRNRANDSRRSQQVEQFRERVGALVIEMRAWHRQAELAPVILGAASWKNIEATTESEYLSEFGMMIITADSALTLAELTISDHDLLSQLAAIREGLDAFRSVYGKIGEALARNPEDRASRVDLVGTALGVATATNSRVDVLIKMTQGLK